MNSAKQGPKDRSPRNAGRVAAEAYSETLPDAAKCGLQDLLKGNFTTSEESCRSHANDWWPISKVWTLEGEVPSMPVAVARPSTRDEVQGVLDLCRESRVPVTTSGGRSGVCGQAVPILGGVVLDTTRMNQLLEIDEKSLCATVEPGLFGHDLESNLRQRGYTSGHFPQSIEISTVGGWIACRSAGQFSNKYGKIEDLVIGFDVALARTAENGNAISFPAIPATAAGPDLRRSFFGSEGVLGVITQATLAISPAPDSSEGLALSFKDFEAGLEVLRGALRAGISPAAARLYDPDETARHFGATECAAMICVAEGTSDEVATQLKGIKRLATNADQGDPRWVAHWLESRNDVSALDVAIERGLVVDTIEVAALWRDVASTYHAVKEAILRVPGAMMASAHSSHAYSTGACLYFTFVGVGVGGQDLSAKDRFYASVWDAAMRAANASGATISHHHGIGIVRLNAFNSYTDRAERDMLRALKRELDPMNILNPGKIGSPEGEPQTSPSWPPSIGQSETH